MTVNAAIIIALIGLILVVGTHIFVIARWSGKVDASLQQILSQPGRWQTDLTTAAQALRTEHSMTVGALRGELHATVEEVKALRKARHETDGKLQLHDGKFTAYDRALERLERFMDEHERECARVRGFGGSS